MSSTAGILIIGNEVLSGKVEEANTGFLIRELRALGVGLERVVFVRDEVEAIAADVADMARRFDYVFTTGGVGATHDDITMGAVARAFDVPLVTHPELAERLRRHFGEGIDPAMARMAELPEGATLISTGEGRFPVVRMRNAFVLPGVPSFLRAKFEHVRPHLSGTPFVLRQVFLSVGEDRIAQRLAEVAAVHPGVEFGSYPRFDDADHRVKITAEARDPAAVASGWAALLAVLEPEWILRED